MRAPTRAREISFTFTPFTPRRVYRPLRSGDGVDSRAPRCLCTRQAFALRSFLRAAAVTAWRKRSSLRPNRCLLPLPQTTRSRSPPIAFSARGAPLVGKETTLSKSCDSAGHGRAAMGEGSVLCTSGRRRTKMDGCGAS